MAECRLNQYEWKRASICQTYSKSVRKIQQKGDFNHRIVKYTFHEFSSNISISAIYFLGRFAGHPDTVKKGSEFLALSYRMNAFISFGVLPLSLSVNFGTKFTEFGIWNFAFSPHVYFVNKTHSLHGYDGITESERTLIFGLPVT